MSYVAVSSNNELPDLCRELDQLMDELHKATSSGDTTQAQTLRNKIRNKIMPGPFDREAWKTKVREIRAEMENGDYRYKKSIRTDLESRCISVRKVEVHASEIAPASRATSGGKMVRCLLVVGLIMIGLAGVFLDGGFSDNAIAKPAGTPSTTSARPLTGTGSLTPVALEPQRIATTPKRTTTTTITTSKTTTAMKTRKAPFALPQWKPDVDIADLTSPVKTTLAPSTQTTMRMKTTVAPSAKTTTAMKTTKAPFGLPRWKPDIDTGDLTTTTTSTEPPFELPQWKPHVDTTALTTTAKTTMARSAKTTTAMKMITTVSALLTTAKTTTSMTTTTAPPNALPRWKPDIDPVDLTTAKTTTTIKTTTAPFELPRWKPDVDPDDLTTTTTSTEPPFELPRWKPDIDLEPQGAIG